MRKIYRHGDVNLVQINEIKGQEVKHKGAYILAEGEATGSVHTIACNDMSIVDDNGTAMFDLREPSTVTHTADHETITIEPGKYIQVPERELDHFAGSVVRKVVD